MCIIVFISGPSGVGKSTISKMVEKSLNNFLHGCILIRQDDYFLPSDQKPFIVLSNGNMVRNWDTMAALDLPKFNADILKVRYQSKPVIVEGFCLPRSEIKVIPDIHIHLSYIDSEFINDIIVSSDIIKERMIKSRREAKPKINDGDGIMVQDIVLPFYLKTVASSLFTHIVPTFIRDERIPLENVFSRVYEIIAHLIHRL